MLFLILRAIWPEVLIILKEERLLKMPNQDKKYMLKNFENELMNTSKSLLEQLETLFQKSLDSF